MAKSGTKNHEKDQNDFLAVADQGAEGSKPPLETETRSVEIRSQPESLSEKREEREREEKKEGPEKSAPPARRHTIPSPPSVPVPSMPPDPFLKEVESILEEDLTDLFLKMTPEQQRLFKRKGEETATKIWQLLASAKVNARKVLSLIRNWLKMIPGVNRFFLEQEAKIKTDKLLQASDDRKEKGGV